MTKMNPNDTYSKEELQVMIKQMRVASSIFYSQATLIGNHAFIEFTGLMNEYIKVCEQAVANGEDFTRANIHTGRPIPSYMVKYFEEKMSCILGRDVVIAMAA